MKRPSGPRAGNCRMQRLCLDACTQGTSAGRRMGTACRSCRAGRTISTQAGLPSSAKWNKPHVGDSSGKQHATPGRRMWGRLSGGGRTAHLTLLRTPLSMRKVADRAARSAPSKAAPKVKRTDPGSPAARRRCCCCSMRCSRPRTKACRLPTTLLRSAGMVSSERAALPSARGSASPWPISWSRTTARSAPGVASRAATSSPAACTAAVPRLFMASAKALSLLSSAPGGMGMGPGCDLMSYTCTAAPCRAAKKAAASSPAGPAPTTMTVAPAAAAGSGLDRVALHLGDVQWAISGG